MSMLYELTILISFRTLAVMASLLERYEAAMVLSGTGDSLGYKNGSWEFCHSGTEIYKELVLLGGLKKIKLKCENGMHVCKH